MEKTFVSTRDDRENVIQIYNAILFSHEKEGNPAICDNMNKTLGHYTKWNKSLC